MGKNNNKPVRAPPPVARTDDDFEAKPFHSKQFEQEYLDSLVNAKERPSWDEFKAEQRRKGDMESADARAEEEAQRQFRQELDQERQARLNARRGGGEAEGSSKKSKKEKKEKKEKRKKEKKKRKHEHGDEAGDKKNKKTKSKADAPVSLSSFFRASSSDESD